MSGTRLLKPSHFPANWLNEEIGTIVRPGWDCNVSQPKTVVASHVTVTSMQAFVSRFITIFPY
jgi:hypothetical protein